MKLSSALVLVGLMAVVTTRDAPSDPKSGLDPASFDSSVRPQDDLYRFVNGRWLAITEIPSDRVAYGAFTELTEKAEADLRAIIEEDAAELRSSRLRTCTQASWTTRGLTRLALRRQRLC